MTELASQPELQTYAIQGGAAVFRAHCIQCHGSGADGIADGNGYPHLGDDDWLWGGGIDDILYTITHGIRNEDDWDARWSEMQAFGNDGILTGDEVDRVVQHVLAISGQEHDAAMATDGAELFAVHCVSCHGPEGLGDPTQGAPNLTDRIWLYGGDCRQPDGDADEWPLRHHARLGCCGQWPERGAAAPGRGLCPPAGRWRMSV